MNPIRNKPIAILIPLLLTLLPHQTARAYYDPGVQRWINRDPIQEHGGKNVHCFIGNDPVNVIDSNGLAGQPGLLTQLGWACGCWLMAHDEANKAGTWANATVGTAGAMHHNEGSPADMLTHCVGACEIAKNEGLCLIAGIDIRKKVQQRERDLNRGGDKMDYENNKIGFAIADAELDCKQGCLQAFAEGRLWTVDQMPPYRAHPAGPPPKPTATPPRP